MEYYLVMQKILSKNYNKYRSLQQKIYYRRYSSELALHESHWLPIKVRIEFKIITIMCQSSQ